MPYLHIPLTRHQKTTRRSRWVVWLLGAVLIVVSLGTIAAVNAWFARNTVFSAAPEGTQTAVQLLLNKRTWPTLSHLLKQTPLISNRSLTIDDVAPFTNGELGWFFHEDGTRSIALRTNAEKIPQELLDAQHIVQQQINRHLFLLSEKLQPVSGIKPKSTEKQLFPFTGNKLGIFFSVGQEKATEIQATKDELTFSLATKAPAHIGFDPRHIPQDTSLILSTPVLSNTVEHTATASFSHLLDPLIGQSFEQLFTSLLSKNGVLIQTRGEYPSFLLFSTETVPNMDRLRFLQTSLAVKNPTIQKRQLLDQTISKELIADPSLISVEERTMSGRSFYKASSPNQTLFLSKEGDFLLTNSEELAKFWMDDQAKTDVSKNCNTNVGLINTQDLLGLNAFSTVYTPDILRPILSSFRFISIEESGKNLLLHACY